MKTVSKDLEIKLEKIYQFHFYLLLVLFEMK